MLDTIVSTTGVTKREPQARIVERLRPDDPFDRCSCLVVVGGSYWPWHLAAER